MAVNKVVFGGQSIIDISDATVTPDKMLEGVVAYDSAGNKISGEIVNCDAALITIGAGDTYKIPKGFHNGSGLVTVKGPVYTMIMDEDAPNTSIENVSYSIYTTGLGSNNYIVLELDICTIDDTDTFFAAIKLNNRTINDYIPVRSKYGDYVIDVTSNLFTYDFELDFMVKNPPEGVDSSMIKLEKIVSKIYIETP